MFKDEFTLAIRQEKCLEMLKRQPSGIPVVCESASPGLRHMSSREFTVPRAMTIGALMFRIRQHIKLSQKEALFVFVNDTLVPGSAEMGELYDWHKGEDGWFYITYASENTFGA